MTDTETQKKLQQHVAEKGERDRKARRSGLVKVTLYTLGAGLEAYADINGYMPTFFTVDNALGFGGAAVSALTSLVATRKKDKHEDQLAAIEDRCLQGEIGKEEALHETEYHIDHRRKDTKRYVWLTAGGTALSAGGFGHALASGHMDNHYSLMAAAASIVAANIYSLHSIVHGVKNIRDDKAEVKRVARIRKRTLG